MPVGYEDFPGNVNEVSSLFDALVAREMRHVVLQWWPTRQCQPTKTRPSLKDRGTPYFLGDRLKSTPALLKKRILGKRNYRGLGRKEHSDSIGGFRTIDEDGLRFVVTHSPKLAHHDYHYRERTLEVAGSPCERRRAGLVEFPRNPAIP